MRAKVEGIVLEHEPREIVGMPHPRFPVSATLVGDSDNQFIHVNIYNRRLNTVANISIKFNPETQEVVVSVAPYGIDSRHLEKHTQRIRLAILAE